MAVGSDLSRYRCVLVFFRQLQHEAWLQRERAAQEEFRKKREEKEHKLKEREEREVSGCVSGPVWLERVLFLCVATDSRGMGSHGEEGEGGRGETGESKDGQRGELQLQLWSMMDEGSISSMTSGRILMSNDVMGVQDP